MFDFDSDGSVEPWEVGLGASLIGMGGLALDAEEVSYNDRKEYEDELDRKQSHIDELEDELKELRHRRDSEDYFNKYYNDDDSYDGDDSDDDYGSDENDSADDCKYELNDSATTEEHGTYYYKVEEEDEGTIYRKLLVYLEEDGSYDYKRAQEDGVLWEFDDDEWSEWIEFTIQSFLEDWNERSR